MAQLAHSGAVSHPDFFNGELPLAPSAINLGLWAFTSTGFKDTVTPRAMTLADVLRTSATFDPPGEGREKRVSTALSFTARRLTCCHNF